MDTEPKTVLDSAPASPEAATDITTAVESGLISKAAHLFAYSLGGVILCVSPFILSGSSQPSLLERIKEQGFLQVLTFNGPSTYYEGRFGHAGFEYELAKSFADKLEVELIVQEQQSLSDILTSVTESKDSFAAAGLSILDDRKSYVDFSHSYANVNQQVVYRRGNKKPKKISDLIGQKIVVASKSSHVKTLKKFQKEHPKLVWIEKDNVEMADTLSMIHNGEADITLVDSTAYIANKVIYPKARLGFTLDESESIAWAFPKSRDTSLFNAANRFLQKQIDSGSVSALEAKYFSEPIVDEGSALAFARRIEKRLPKWESYFQEASIQYDVDWLFLAAMSYQESLWNANAKSYTGVRGLMMLTRRTAQDLGVTDRTDPEQSIKGGARYFKKIHQRIQSDITEPDRTWMALASYNVGLGHLEDARKITDQQGGDPDIWDDVKERLPLLAKRQYYSKTRHGYARGWEPVHYVENIRNYHNILVWHYDNKQQEAIADVKSAAAEVATLTEKPDNTSTLLENVDEQKVLSTPLEPSP